VNHRFLLGLFGRVVSSLVFAGIFYTGWMAVAIAVYKSGLDSFALKVLVWLSPPVVTAAGFAVGVAIFELLPHTRKSKFGNIFRWSLIGCAIGAGIVVWFGPMLIVFGMFALGTASVALRDLMIAGKQKS
jgi:hypothetical protein